MRAMELSCETFVSAEEYPRGHCVLRRYIEQGIPAQAEKSLPDPRSDSGGSGGRFLPEVRGSGAFQKTNRPGNTMGRA